MTDAVSLLLHNGWEPIDLWQVVRRRATASAACLLAGVLPRAVSRMSDSSALRRANDQLREMEGARILGPGHPAWAADLSAAVAAIAVLSHLPAIPSLNTWHPSAESDGGPGSACLLAKIRALLAKAESTEFSEEAEALTLKATELMARHRIDLALVEAAAKYSGTGKVVALRFWLDSPYVQAKRLLLGVVADAYGCRAVGSEYGFVTLAGDAMDLEMTEVLFTSLLVQATNQLRIIEAESRAEQAEAKASATTLLDFMDERDIDPETAGELVASILTRMRAARQRNPAFRRSFLVAYAQRIGVRLTEAARATAEGAEAEVGGAFLPVLARRARSVDAAVESMFGVLRSSVIRATDAAGWAAGTAAADLAELSVRRRLPAARTG